MVLGGIVVVVVGVLIFNYFKDKNSQTIPAISTENGAGTYMVKSGDTLWSIAENSFGSGYNWVDIKKANNLTSDKIEIGQKLTIPNISAKQPTVTKKTAVSETPQSISGDSYTVVKGDSLWKIAVSAYGDGYKWVEIARANKLANPNIIHAGNVLTISR